MHIKKFDKFINEQHLIKEALSKQVYHYTTTDKLISILNSNKINLSTHLGTSGDDVNSKGFYFLSLTRTKNSQLGFARNMVGSGEYLNVAVRIEFDGTLLNNHHKSSSVDYWQRKDYAEVLKMNGGNQKATKDRMMKDFEFEDRLFSDKASIDNIRKYIKCISIFVPDDKERTSEKQILKVKEIIKLCRENNINVFTYHDLKSFDFEIKSNDVSDKILTIEGESESNYRSHNTFRFVEKIAALILFKNEYFSDSDSYLLIKDAHRNFLIDNAIEVEDIDKSFSTTYDYMNKLLHGDYSISDFLSALKSDIHNLSKSGTDVGRKELQILSNDMKRWKVKNLVEYVHLKVNGKKPKHWENKKYSEFYQLAYKSDYEDEAPQVISSDKVLSDFHRLQIYRNLRVVQSVKDKLMDMIFDKKSTIADFIDYMMSNYTVEKVVDMINKGEFGDFIIIKK